MEVSEIFGFPPEEVPPATVATPAVSPGPPSSLMVSLVALVFVSVAAGCWFAWGLAPSVVFGPWQGLFLQEPSLFYVPVVYERAASFLTNQLTADPALLLNLFSALFGALSCGATAALTAALVRPAVSPCLAAVAGIAAGCILAYTPALFYASTGAGPDTFALFFCLIALLLIVRGLRQEGRGTSVMFSGLFLGVAAADHPAFAVLALFLLFVLILGGRHAEIRFVATAGYCIAFLLAFSLPFSFAQQAGESLPGFLRHALLTPYPMLGGGAPSLDALRDVAIEISPAALLLAAAAFVFMRRVELRFELGVLVLVLVLMTWLLPFFVHNAGPGALLSSHQGPKLLGVALLCALVGVGLAQAIQWGRAFPRFGAPTAALLCMVSLLVPLWPALPDRRHDYAEELGRTMLQSMPLDGILVSGNPLVSSLLLATQRVTGLRKDVTILPLEVLGAVPLRQRALQTLLKDIRGITPTPAPGAIDRWKEELPFHFSEHTFDDDRNTQQRLQQFALWEIVQRNVQRRAAFAAVAPDWLAARAEIAGFMLFYPRRFDEPAVPPALDWLPKTLPRDLNAELTFTALLLPLSDAARRQGALEDAAAYAHAAASMLPHSPEPLVLDLLARARSGDSEALLAGAEEIFTHGGEASEVPLPLEEALRKELERHAGEQAAYAYLEQDDESIADLSKRREALDPLWRLDGLNVLRFVYGKLVERLPEDIDAHYQLAAVYAQLGLWDEADMMLAFWASIGQFQPQDMIRQLDGDGRFALFQRHRRSFLPPEQPV